MIFFLECCQEISITLYEHPNAYQSSRAGIYSMKSKLHDGQKYWVSPEGNAIWYESSVASGGWR